MIETEFGDSLWQFITPNGDNKNNNLIIYKSIDIDTDMILATSGSSNINYNRIISYASAPYTVNASSSYSFTDNFSANSLIKIKGLFIIDIDHAVSLIYDTSNYKSSLAILDFTAQNPTV